MNGTLRKPARIIACFLVIFLIYGCAPLKKEKPAEKKSQPLQSRVDLSTEIEYDRAAAGHDAFLLRSDTQDISLDLLSIDDLSDTAIDAGTSADFIDTTDTTDTTGTTELPQETDAFRPVTGSNTWSNTPDLRQPGMPRQK